MSFEFDFALECVPVILAALGTTLFVTIASFVGAATLGLFLEIGRRGGAIRKAMFGLWIDFIRSTPVIAWIYLLYFVLPHYHIRLSAISVGILALSVYYSGYMAAVYKAGLDAIASGQREAALALGLNRYQTIRFVIFPQMLRNVAVPLANYVISVLKATPYLAVIAVPEMLGSALDIASSTFRYVEPLLVSGVIFLALALGATQVVQIIVKLYLGPHSNRAA